MPQLSFLYWGSFSVNFSTCLRLNFILVPYIITFFRKIAVLSPACALCGASIEDVKRYFLYCPSFAALREKLFTSAAHLLENRWHCASDKKKIDWLLNGISNSDFLINITLGCFSLFSRLFCYQIAPVSCCACFLYLFIFCLVFSFLFYSFAFSCVCVCVCSIMTCICIFKLLWM